MSELRIKIADNGKDRILMISGKENDTDIHLEIDGREMPFHSYSVSSPRQYRLMICLLQDDVSRIDAASPSEKAVLKDWDLLQKTERTQLLYQIIDTSYQAAARKLTVAGWILMREGSRPVMEIWDDREKKMPAELHMAPCRDAEGTGIRTEDGELVFFTIVCRIDPKRDYSLVISDEKDAAETSVFTHLPESGFASAFRKILRHLNMHDISRLLQSLRENGIDGTKEKLKHAAYLTSYYHDWFLQHRLTYEQWRRQKETSPADGPVISLIVPVYNTPVSFLKEMIDSVVNQSYSRWELCIADGSDPDHPARKVVQNYAAADPRIRVVYLDQNYGISGNTNKALELVTGDYTAMYDHDDFLEWNALYDIAEAITERHCDIVYTDEDKFSTRTQRFEDPNLKPDFSIDLLRSHNYITHLFAVRTDILKETGGFHSEYDGSQDYDVILRCIEKTEWIYHLPEILYHWRRHAGSTAERPESKMYCYEAGQKAIQAHLDRMGIDGRVEMMPKPYWGLYHVIYTVQDEPLVSIIIPNCENKDVLKRCIDSLYNVNTYQNFEIIIVENNSRSDEIFAYYEQLKKEHDNIRTVIWPGKEFNFSAISNFGETYVRGEYLLFLNNDTEVINPDSIYEMLGTLQREEVGVVGAKLLYADNTVQHAGVVIGIGNVAGHIFHGIDQGAPGYMMQAVISCDYSAVTGACMMTKKRLFEKAGGFDEDLAVAFNDIDYCLKIREMDKLVVYNAFSLWHHYESVSRGYEETPEKKERFARESSLFHDRWIKYMDNHDPYYNTNFDVHYTPFELH